MGSGALGEVLEQLRCPGHVPFPTLPEAGTAPSVKSSL